MLKFHIRSLVAVHDLFMVALAWELAWLIRFNLDISSGALQTSVAVIPLILCIQGIIFYRFHLYFGLWRFASLPDLWNIIKAAMLGALFITLALFILFRLESIPRSVLVLYPLLLIFLLGGPRLGYRFWKDHSLRFNHSDHRKKVLIIGAGRAGELLAREMLHSGNYALLGFIDDNPSLQKSAIHQVRILGTVNELEEVVEGVEPDLIVIAIPSATNRQMQRILEKCEATNVPIQTLPKLDEMVTQAPYMNTIRELSIEDLLGREQAELDWRIIQEGLAHQNVLVTGGGGSIGAELCHQIAKIHPEQLIIYEQSEYHLYTIVRMLKSAHPRLPVVGVLGDICDAGRLDHIFSTFRPGIIFHAAAYKQVPLLEKASREAVRNNIFGTMFLADAALRRDCEKFVLISTDKAVNAQNVLGQTKRVAEMICESQALRAGTKFLTVRFGNVLGSNGSVAPLFQEQIQQGGPVTVTHPEVTRYFMTIKEACLLIMQASVMGRGGEIYVLDMGQPVKIAYLAEQMIKLSRSSSHSDVAIEYIGLRPGEKLHEELFHANEAMEKTPHGKILLARHPPINVKALERRIDELKIACAAFEEERIKQILDEIIAEDRQLANPVIKN